MERRYYREIKTVQMGDSDNPDVEVNPGRQPYGSSKMQGLASTQVTGVHEVNFGAIWLENFASNGEYVREIITNTKWRSGPGLNKVTTDLCYENCGYWCSPEDNEWSDPRKSPRKRVHCRIEWFADDPFGRVG